MKTFTTDQIEEATAYVMAHDEATVNLLDGQPILLMVFAVFVSKVISTLEEGEYE